MPCSHQNESTFFVGELVAHNDFHGGPSSSNHMTAPEMVITCTLTSMFGRTLDAWGPPPKTYGPSTWPNFVAPQLFLAVGEEGQPGKQLYITIKKSTSQDVGMKNLASHRGGIPNYFTSGSGWNVGVIGASTNELSSTTLTLGLV